MTDLTEVPGGRLRIDESAPATEEWTAATHTRYRPEIDGLRAVAILSVIGFHAFPEYLRGGFVGVDIFFVISGFLISSIIFGELESGSFSFARFYGRRVRRIFPALVLVLAFSLAAGWMLLFQNEFRELGKEVAGGASFAANFVLWGESGYFDGPAESKPLLHLWSLGIEEQFYLFWPLAVWLCWKVRPLRLALIMTALAVSFLLSLNAVVDDATAAFYSPLCRMWELMVGALLAWMSQFARSTPSSSAVRHGLSAIGLAMLAFAVLKTPRAPFFPGWWALPPVAGAALAIAAGPAAWPNRFALAHPWAVAIGRISYPLYLWHWPLLSFAHIVVQGPLTTGVRVAILGVAMGFAALTYRYLERPIRFGPAPRRKAQGLVVALAALGIAGLGALTLGWSTRLSPTAYAEVVAAINDWHFPGDLRREEIDGIEVFRNLDGPPEVLMMGDSHVKQFGPRITALTKRGQARSVLLLVDDQCAPIPGVDEALHQKCRSLIEHARRLLGTTPSIKTVLIGGCWNCYFLGKATTNPATDPYDWTIMDDGVPHSLQTEKGRSLALSSLVRFTDQLSSRYATYVLLDNPADARFNPSHLLSGSRGRLAFTLDPRRESKEVRPAAFLADPAEVELDRTLRARFSAGPVRALEQLDGFCPGGECEAVDAAGRPFYSDDHHFRPFVVAQGPTVVDPLVSVPTPP